MFATAWITRLSIFRLVITDEGSHGLRTASRIHLGCSRSSIDLFQLGLTMLRYARESSSIRFVSVLCKLVGKEQNILPFASLQVRGCFLARPKGFEPPTF
jgi:hypothetical protein